MESKIKIIASLLISLFANMSFAASNYKLVCPSVSAIKSKGLVVASPHSYKGYSLSNSSRYQTGSYWMFVLEEISASSPEEALMKGNTLLAQLSGEPIPQETEGFMHCDYTILQGFRAEAIAFPG